MVAPSDDDCMKLREKCRLQFKNQMEERGYEFPEDLVPS